MFSGGGGINHTLKFLEFFRVATVFTLCFEEACKFISIVYWVCLASCAIHTQLGLPVELYRPLSIRSLTGEE